MSTIGRTPQVGNQNQQILNSRNQEAALRNDVSKAKEANVSTLGRTSHRQGEDSKKIDDLQVGAPKESFVASEASSPTVSGDSEETQQFSAEVGEPGADASTIETDSGVQEPEPKQSDLKFGALVEQLNSGKLERDELVEIMTNATTAAQETGAADQSQQEGHLATAALEYSTGKIQEKMPDASLEEIREAAKTDGEVAKWTSIADSASDYLQAVDDEGPPITPGTGQVAGDPFARGSETGSAAGIQEPGGIDPMESTKAMAENQKTMEEMRNIYSQMWAEMMKAQAERHKLMMDTMTAILDMSRQSHLLRMQSAAKHTQSFLAAIVA